MGADFIVSCVVVPSKYTENGFTNNTETSFVNDMRYFVDNKLRLEDHYAFFDSFDPEYLSTHELHRAIDNFCEMSYREYAILKIGESFAYISGGMSWGDSPSDAFDIICHVNDICSAMNEIGD